MTPGVIVIALILTWVAGAIFGTAIRDLMLKRLIRRDGMAYVDQDTRLVGKVEVRRRGYWHALALLLLMTVITSAHAQTVVSAISNGQTTILSCGPGYQILDGGCVTGGPHITYDLGIPASNDLTVRDIVKVLAEYDVRHGDQQPFFKPSYGATDPYGRAIWVFNGQTHDEKLCTVIHELLHAHDVTMPEDQVEREEARQCKTLFP